MTAPLIFHIARATEWEDAQPTGEYRVSTVGRTLDEEGFIHCSADGAQGATVLHNYYAQIDEPLVVLVIDTERVPSDQVNVLGHARIRLADDLESGGLLHVPPPMLGRCRRIPAKR